MSDHPYLLHHHRTTPPTKDRGKATTHQLPTWLPTVKAKRIVKTVTVTVTYEGTKRRRGNESQKMKKDEKKGAARKSQFHTKFTYTQNNLRQSRTWSFLSLFFPPFILHVFSFFLGRSDLKLGMKWRGGGNGTYGSLGLEVGYSLA